MSDQRLTKNFKRSEFDCKCDDEDCTATSVNMMFVDTLQDARTRADIPFIIVSGVRCDLHNAKVGGKPDSSHLLGLAADIKYTNYRECFIIVVALLSAGFNRIGIGKNFIHVDLDLNKDPKVIWNYYPKKEDT